MAKYNGLDCILLVDDDPITNFLHKKTIEQVDIEASIETCDSANCALSFINGDGEFESKPQPGIIFLDINMPGMNGWEFLDQYDKLPEQKRAQKVIAMLTTSLNPDDRKKAGNQKHVRSFYSKPLKKEYIQQLIEEHF